MKPRFFQKLLNNAGLGLIEVMVAGSIAMVVIFGVGKALIDSQKSQKNVQIGQNAGFFTNQIASMFTANCPMATMSPAYLYDPAVLSAAPVNMDFGDVNMGWGTIRLTAGTTLPNMDLKINSLRMQNIIPDGPIYTTNGINYQTHNATLYISFTKLGSTLGVQTTKETKMGVSIVTQEPSKSVVRCSFHGSDLATSLSTADYAAVVDQASRTACESNGGVWNTLVTPKRCDFPKDCKLYGSYASPGAGAGSGAYFINPFTGAYSCPANGSTPYQQGVVTTAVSCGKGCVQSVFTKVYTCMLCGSSALGGGSVPLDPCNGACDPTTQYCAYNGSSFYCEFLSTTSSFP